MARKRMIDPEFWLDEDITKLDYVARLFYIGTWNFSDDYAVIENSPKKLKAQIFPYDEVDVVPIIESLVKMKKYIPFEADEKKYLFIKNFLKYQRVDKPSINRNPSPSQELLDEYSATTQEPLKAEVKRREVKRREENIYNDDKFNSFWSLYPKKVGKPKTFELWKELSEKTKDKILLDVVARMQDEKWIGGFIKDPERYIKNQQWEDEIRRSKTTNKTIEL